SGASKALVTTPVQLTIASSVLQESEVGATYAALLSAIGGTKPYYWTLTPGTLPAGLELQTLTGAITGMASIPGSYSFAVKVTDSTCVTQRPNTPNNQTRKQLRDDIPPVEGPLCSSKYSDTAIRALNLTVASQLSVEHVPLREADPATSYTAMLFARGGVEPYRWSVTTGGLPSGLRLQAANGAIAGIATIPGSYLFSATVTDFYGKTATRHFNLTVTPPLAVTNPAPSEAEAGMPYTSSFSATGGSPPYQWSLTSGAFPSGIHLQPSSGDITGMTGIPGSYPFTAGVTDANQNKVMFQSMLNVAPALAISNSALTEAEVGAAYTFSLSATGGIPPYRWSVATGALPLGMQLQTSGGIAGTTATPGSYLFTVKATDSASNSVTQKLILAVLPATNMSGNFDGPAELPRVYLNTTLANTPAPGATISVPAGGDLQTALDNASCGDTIELQAGATFSTTGLLTFPAKACDSGHWIIVRTSTSDASLPPEGTRLTPCYAGVASLPGRPVFSCTKPQHLLATLTYAGIGSGPITFANGANHYRLVGLEITRVAGNGKAVTALAGPEVDGSMNWIVFDRCYIHGVPVEETRRGVELSGGTSIAVQDSYVSDFHCNVKGTCTDSQAVSGGDGTLPSGPYRIVDNFLEASGENIIFGGGAATQTPADIEIRFNHFFKPMFWMPGQPGFSKPAFIVKNNFELKNAQRVLFDSNVVEDTWGGFTQHGYSVVITPKNQHGDG